MCGTAQRNETLGFKSLVQKYCPSAFQDSYFSVVGDELGEEGIVATQSIGVKGRKAGEGTIESSHHEKRVCPAVG